MKVSVSDMLFLDETEGIERALTRDEQARRDRIIAELRALGIEKLRGLSALGFLSDD